jgi:GntR family transcriptional regulator/MocR family aminotransferase
MLMPPTLLEHSSEPVYMQIYGYFRTEILCGRLPSTHKLPSIRQLAQHLGISRNPVESAYAQLVAEGYIVNKPKSGYTAAQMERWTLPDQELLQSNDSPSNGIPSNKISSNENPNDNFHPDLNLKNTLPNTTPTIAYDYDQMDTNHFPFDLWRKITLQVLRPAASELLQYGNKKGESGLRKLITEHLKHNRGVECDPEQVIITSGTQQAAIMLSWLLHKEHRILAVEATIHPGLHHVFRHQGLTTIPIPVGADGISLNELSSDPSLRAVYVTPSHQFPYGMILSAAKRIKLLQWAADTNGIIIEDDYDSDFLFEGRPVPALQGLDRNGCVVYLGTFSKALAPSIRLSYMILPPALLERFENEFTYYDQTASRLTQKTMELMMVQGHFERHVRRMRKIYSEKRTALLAAIQLYFGQQAQVSGASSGLHLILHIDCSLPLQVLVQKAADCGVQIHPVTDYRATQTVLQEPVSQTIEVDSQEPLSQVSHRFLLGFGGLSTELITEGIRRIAEAWFPTHIC